MARIRTIKPEFWTSEQIAECSPIARLLFIGLWNFCDDSGIHPASIKRVKMEIFPGDDFSPEQIQGWLEELLSKGLIKLYTAENQDFFQVTGWHHQKIDKPNPKYPQPDNSTTFRRTFSECSEIIPPRKGRESKVVEGKGEEGKEPLVEPQAASTPVDEIFTHWQKTMGHEQAKLDDKRKKNIRDALKWGYTVEQLKQAITGCSVTPHNIGINDRSQRYDGLHVIFQSADNIDRFIRNHHDPPRILNGQQKRESANKTVAMEWASGSQNQGEIYDA